MNNQEATRTQNVIIDELQGRIASWYNWTYGKASKMDAECKVDNSKGFYAQIVCLLSVLESLYAWTRKETIEICFTQRTDNWWLFRENHDKDARQKLLETMYPYGDS